MRYHSIFLIHLSTVGVSSFLITGCGSGQFEEEKYLPLKVGHSWQYKIQTQDMDLQKNYKYVVVNKGPEKINDIDASTREINDEILIYLQKTATGIRRIGMKKKRDINTRFEEEDFHVLGYPIELGTQWQQQTTTGVLEVVIAPFRRHYALQAPVTMQYTITSLEEKVSVPAGKYSTCIKVDGEGKTRAKADKSLGNLKIKVKSSDWYCPDVGLVKSERVESTDSTVLVQGTFLMELESFSSN